MNILVISLNALSQGLLWSVMAIGVYITYRILDIADLTAEGSFTLGAAVACKLITNGTNPVIATLVSIFAGMLAGLATGIIHTKFKIPALLSGILTMTALWSVNLRIMGAANISLIDPNTFQVKSLLTSVEALGLSKTNAAILAGIVMTAIVIAILWWFFNTELGYSLRATGNNKHMIRALGVNTNATIILGIVIGNALIALSAAMVAQYNGYADISMGTGTIVIGLASVIIGEVVFSNGFSFKALIAVALGSILYRLIIAVVLELGMRADDLKLLNSILLIIVLVLPRLKQNYWIPFSNKLKKKG